MSWFEDPVDRRLRTLKPGAQNKPTWRIWWAERLAWASDQEWATTVTAVVYGVVGAIGAAMVFVKWWRE